MTPELEDARSRAESLAAERRLREASEAWDEVAEGAEEEYGANDPRALAAAARRIRELHASGLSGGAAVPAAVRAARALEDVLGPGHPEAILAAETSAAILAGEDLEASQAELSEVARRSEEALGPGHPQTASARRTMASVMFFRGDGAGASTALREAAAVCSGSLKPGCAETLDAMDALADAMAGAGGAADAAGLLALAHGKLKETLGDSRPETLHAAARLAAMLRLAGDREGAGRLAEETLAAASDVLGQGHPIALEAMETLALAAGDLEGPGAAADLLSWLLEASETEQGTGAPLTLRAGAHLARALAVRGNRTGARELLERTFRECSLALGPSHADTLGRADMLADSMLDLGEMESASALLRGILETRERVLGAAHPDASHTRSELAETLHALGDHESAKALMGGAMERLTAGKASAPGQAAASGTGTASAPGTAAAGPGPAHPASLSAAAGLARALSELGESDGAREVLARALESAEATLGPAHPAALAVKAPLAAAIRSGEDGGAPESVRLAAEVLDGRSAALGSGHPDSVRARLELARALSSGGFGTEAGAAFAEALAFAAALGEPGLAAVSEAAAGLGAGLALEGDRAGGIFFLKVAAYASRKARGTLPAMGRWPGRAFIAGTEERLRAFFDLLMEEERHAEAIAVLTLVKEEELGGLDPARLSRHDRTSAATANLGGGSPGSPPGSGPANGDRPAGLGTSAPAPYGGERGTAPDLFGGTPDGAAWAVFLEDLESYASLESELASLEARRAGGTLAADGERRLAGLPESSAEARSALLELCAGIRSLLKPSGEPPAAPGSWTHARLEALRTELAEGGFDAMLVASSAQDALWLLTITQGTVAARRSETDPEELARLVRGFREAVRDPALDPKPAARRLHEVVMAPSEEDLKAAGTRTLALALDGPLRYAPLSAL
jgi:tetratricopeptide (TPR) repeat protein